MKYSNPIRWPRLAAFTLIELMVVIAIIGVLAALVFPALRAAKISATRGKVNMELKQLEIAIEAYKARYGFYPPDSARPEVNRLFYELLGTAQKGAAFEPLDGRESVPAATVKAVLGVDSFVNCSRAGGGDDSKGAEKFLRNLKPDQYRIISTNNARFGMLVCSVPGPGRPGEVILGLPEVNPWRYISSNPTHNPKSFDLWADVLVAGKTNRISNWNKYEIVP